MKVDELTAQLEATHQSIPLVQKSAELIVLLGMWRTQIEVIKRLDRIVDALDRGIKFKPEHFHGKN